jgi:hypothetical protein
MMRCQNGTCLSNMDQWFVEMVENLILLALAALIIVPILMHLNRQRP